MIEGQSKLLAEVESAKKIPESRRCLIDKDYLTKVELADAGTTPMAKVRLKNYSPPALIGKGEILASHYDKSHLVLK